MGALAWLRERLFSAFAVVGDVARRALTGSFVVMGYVMVSVCGCYLCERFCWSSCGLGCGAGRVPPTTYIACWDTYML